MIDFLKLAYLSGAKLAREEFLDDSHGALEGLDAPRYSYPDVPEEPREPVRPTWMRDEPSTYDQAVDWMSRNVMPSLDVAGFGDRLSEDERALKARGGLYPDNRTVSPAELARRHQESMRKNKRAIYTAHKGELEGETPISERIPGTNRRGATWWHW
jgi:hypothetical protein